MPNVVQPPEKREHIDKPKGTAGIENQLLDRLQTLDPTKFEHLVGAFLKAKGLEDVQITGKSGDQGIDGTCIVPFLNLSCAFQAKRYGLDNSVGGPAVRNFKGGVVGRYDRGIFITTSNFTPGAIEEAEQPGVTIILVEGKQLVSEMAKLGLGVNIVPIVEKVIDEGFFDKLGK